MDQSLPSGEDLMLQHLHECGLRRKDTPQNRTSLAVPAKIPDQASTPTASKPTLDDTTIEPYHGRGIRLNVYEQQCLISICRDLMEHYELGHHPKSFWLQVSASLFQQTGRRYSWQSCRRRIAGYIEKRKAYWFAYKLNQDPECDMHDDVADDLDSWMGSCDRRAGRPVRQEVAMKSVEKPEERNTSGPVQLVSMQQLIKYTRVANWVDSLPHPREMDSLPTKFGIPSLTWSSPFYNLQTLSYSQSPSQSPLQAEFPLNRQRPGAPRATQLPTSETPSYAGLPNGHPENSRKSANEVIVERPERAPSATQNRASYAQENPHNTQAGNKRPRDDDHDNAAVEPPARRLRKDPTSQPTESISPNREDAANDAMAIDGSVENTFGKLWERVAPLFKDPALTSHPTAIKSESIMRDLFSEIGTALAKAFSRLREDNGEVAKA
ncbi:hypothetical protein BDV25DRAFT_151129 [Aspergillus avenaceus]|uniref:Uncharacterized protein n=1 Tax=Aspergillus avenaceus TaxID=36643 RepID=A0A5N6U1F3_ASPAV|nr:hypothetical protein BDV25DRAFT_151129 [Aspergillus avenaceus]